MIFKTGSNTLPGTGCLIRNDLNELAFQILILINMS